MSFGFHIDLTERSDNNEVGDVVPSKYVRKFLRLIGELYLSFLELAEYLQLEFVS